MQLAAYIGLLFSLLLTLAFAVIACRATRRGDDWPLPFVEKGQIASTILVCISSILMLIALVGRDYSFVYVYENVDNTLPFLYRITAFWAGRTGSLLFWHLVAITKKIRLYIKIFRIILHHHRQKEKGAIQHRKTKHQKQ